MDRTIYIGRLFGIEFRLHYTWFIIFFLLTFLLVEPNFQSLSHWMIGILSSFLFFGSVLAHELAHSLVGRKHGIEITAITLFIFGGLATMKGEANKPGAEFKMAIAGPLCSLFLAGIFGLLLFIPAVSGQVADMFFWLAIMNGILGVFNLIPGFPLDGGRVFRSVIWKATGSYLLATRIATIIGQGVGYLFILVGIAIIIFRPFDMTWYNGLWICFLGWFLSNAASSSYRTISRQRQTPPSASHTVVTDVEYSVLPEEDNKEQE